jgi:hypothetical protein
MIVLPRNPKKPPKRTWTRHENDFGEVHYTDSSGCFRIDKHVVDDREYDGGYLVTSYYLYKLERPDPILIDLPFGTLNDAKRHVSLYY